MQGAVAGILLTARQGETRLNLADCQHLDTEKT